MHIICRFQFIYNLSYLFSNCFVNNYKEIASSDIMGHARILIGHGW